MNIFIRIDYLTGSKITQSGTFPLKGKSREQFALEWWKYLKRENSYRATLEKVMANEEDITQQVKDLEEAERRKSEDIDILPF
jgi:dGTP triphosphohydrolase